MNMLDELMEQKGTGITMGLDGEAEATKVISQLDMTSLDSLHVCKKLPVQFDLDNPEDILWLGESHQFDAMLKSDEGGRDDGYRDFIKAWDQLRFDTIPAYNARHSKDNLLELDDTMDFELAKISPAMLAQLDNAKGDPDKVLVLLHKIGWRKSSDNFSFKKAIAHAHSVNDENLAAKLKLKACQDCLFRFCEERADVKLPSNAPRLNALRKKS